MTDQTQPSTAAETGAKETETAHVQDSAELVPLTPLEEAEASTELTLEAPEGSFMQMTDEEIEKLYDSVNKHILGEDTQDQPETKLLPAGVRAMLDKALPKEAIQRFSNQYPVTDADGNSHQMRERASRVQAVIVDYLANKIFGARLSSKIVGHGITSHGWVNVQTDPKAEAKPRYTVTAWAHVRCKVRLDDGSYWMKEDFASMTADTDQQHDTGRAHRIAEGGASTAARRRAVQQYGRVFGGFDVRDVDNSIAEIREKQRQQVIRRQAADAEAQSQEAAYGGDNAPAKPGRAKPGLKISGDLAAAGGAGHGAAKSAVVLAKSKGKGKPAGEAPKDPNGSGPKGGQAKPADKAAEKPAPKPVVVKAKSAKSNGAAAFHLKKNAKADAIEIVDGAIFADTLRKTILKAKTVEEANEILTLNRAEIEKLEKVEKWQELAGKIMTAHEMRLTTINGRKTATERREASAKKKTLEAAANATVDAAVDATKGPTPKTELAETPDHAGFGGPSAPLPQGATQGDEQAPAAEWQPKIEALALDAAGAPTNLAVFGQSALNAVLEAPSEADLDRLLKSLEDDFKKITTQASGFILGKAEVKRASFKPA
jgi:hypothetical protein